MKKSHSFDKLSDKTCDVSGCKTRLKQRIVEEKPTAKKCFKHWSEIEFARRHRDKEATEAIQRQRS